MSVWLVAQYGATWTGMDTPTSFWPASGARCGYSTMTEENCARRLPLWAWSHIPGGGTESPLGTWTEMDVWISSPATGVETPLTRAADKNPCEFTMEILT